RPPPPPHRRRLYKTYGNAVAVGSLSFSLHRGFDDGVAPRQCCRQDDDWQLIELPSGSIHTFGHDMAHERHQVLGRMNREPLRGHVALLRQKSARLRVALARVLAETKFEF